MERDAVIVNALETELAFLSTRSAWSATYLLPYRNKGTLISIHALRMERDMPKTKESARPLISIHALRMERDLVML